MYGWKKVREYWLDEVFDSGQAEGGKDEGQEPPAADDEIGEIMGNDWGRVDFGRQERELAMSRYDVKGLKLRTTLHKLAYLARSLHVDRGEGLPRHD